MEKISFERRKYELVDGKSLPRDMSQNIEGKQNS